MRIVIVIPTYNEASNLEILIPRLDEEFKKIKNHEFVALIVDGNSPDGTPDLIKNLKKDFPFLELLVEKEKEGLGAAYIKGFKYAMEKLNADYVIEMDGDLQHDPDDLKKFVEAIDEGYDYIIGSRFVDGGSIPEEWEFYRRFLSWGGSLFSKIVLGIFNVSDFTTGYKATRVSGFLDQVDFSQIKSKGFAYKIDLLFRMHRMEAKFKEVPIVFGLRDRGDSKMEKDNFLDSLKVVISLRMYEHKSFVKFLITGVAGLFTDTTLFNILRLIVFPGIASAMAGFIAILVTFTLNNFWSFNDRKKTSVKRILKALPVYFIVSYVPILFRSWLITHAILSFGDTFFVANGAFLVGVLIGLVWNFTIYSKVIWRNTNG